MREGVLVSPTKTGTANFVCPKCGEILRETVGAPNPDQRPYVLMCPGCMHIAGQWLTAAERYKELAEYAKNATS
jgi:predicted RNA-binding Zn-ribbon protein involved in translation (DUF1610 family)